MKTNKLSIKPQSTIETCLSMCLIALLEHKGITIEENAEINILIDGLKFTKFDYSTGHLVYVCNKYPVQITQYIENTFFYHLLSKYPYPENMQLVNQKINKYFIEKNKQHLPCILYIDQSYLTEVKGVRISHFVILEKFGKISATILDPWDGKRKNISTKFLMHSIQSLRNNLKISPKLIVLASLGA